MATARPFPEIAEKWALPAQQDRSRAMRGRILKAAETVFAEKGYEGARIADIAKAAKCSVGAVYFRFKDKDALFFAIAESFAEDVRGGMADLTGGENVEAIVRGYVSRTAAQFRAHKGMFRSVVERGFEHPLAMTTIMGIRDEMAEALEHSLAARIKGRRRADLKLAVRVLPQMVYGFLITGVLNARAPTRIDDPRAMNEAADAMIAYLTAKGFLA